MTKTIVSTSNKRGFTVTMTPMNSLFKDAKGELRSVLLGPDGEEAADGVVYYCVQDAIQYVCDISEKRASCTWSEDINASTKALISASGNSTPGTTSCSHGGCNNGLSKFVFHRQSLSVVTFDALMVLIAHLNSGKASNFKTRFANMFTRVTAGDQSLHAEVDRNHNSDAPLNRMARGEQPGVGTKRTRELDDGEPLRQAKLTRAEYDNAVLAANTFGATMAQQKADASSFLECFRKGAEIQRQTELTRQATLKLEASVVEKKLLIEGTVAERLHLETQRARIATEAAAEKAKMELETTANKAKMELELSEKRAIRLAAEREAELAFIERKRRLETPQPSEDAGQPAEPKTVRQIAMEENFWQGLPKHMRDDLLSRTGMQARKVTHCMLYQTYTIQHNTTQPRHT